MQQVAARGRLRISESPLYPGFHGLPDLSLFWSEGGGRIRWVIAAGKGVAPHLLLVECHQAGSGGSSEPAEATGPGCTRTGLSLSSQTRRTPATRSTAPGVSRQVAGSCNPTMPRPNRSLSPARSGSAVLTDVHAPNGSGSSRDWAAKGTTLLGVKAVIAETYERIHRRNLVGMGVLPLQFHAGEHLATYGLIGKEVFETVIPRSGRLAEAPSFGKTILAYDPRSRGAEAYIQLAKEILAHEHRARSESAQSAR